MYRETRQDKPQRTKHLRSSVEEGAAPVKV
jgi:hypothetical protein